MKYKNITNGILRFRAYNKKMEKVDFKVQPGKYFEVGKEVISKGIEKVSEKEKIKRPLKGKEK